MGEGRCRAAGGEHRGVQGSPPVSCTGPSCMEVGSRVPGRAHPGLVASSLPSGPPAQCQPWAIGTPPSLHMLTAPQRLSGLSAVFLEQGCFLPGWASLRLSAVFLL